LRTLSVEVGGIDLVSANEAGSAFIRYVNNSGAKALLMATAAIVLMCL